MNHWRVPERIRGVSVLTLCWTLSMASQLTIHAQYSSESLCGSCILLTSISKPCTTLLVGLKWKPNDNSILLHQSKNCTTGCRMYYPFTFYILPALYLHHYVYFYSILLSARPISLSNALLCDCVQLLTHFKLGQLLGIISLTAGPRTLHFKGSHNYTH